MMTLDRITWKEIQIWKS